MMMMMTMMLLGMVISATSRRTKTDPLDESPLNSEDMDAAAQPTHKHILHPLNPPPPREAVEQGRASRARMRQR